MVAPQPSIVYDFGPGDEEFIDAGSLKPYRRMFFQCSAHHDIIVLVTSRVFALVTGRVLALALFQVRNVHRASRCIRGVLAITVSDIVTVLGIFPHIRCTPHSSSRITTCAGSVRSRSSHLHLKSGPRRRYCAGNDPSHTPPLTRRSNSSPGTS